MLRPGALDGHGALIQSQIPRLNEKWPHPELQPVLQPVLQPWLQPLLKSPKLVALVVQPQSDD